MTILQRIRHTDFHFLLIIFYNDSSNNAAKNRTCQVRFQPQKADLRGPKKGFGFPVYYCHRKGSHPKGDGNPKLEGEP